MSSHVKPPKSPNSSDASQVLMLAMQIQTMALAIEEFRGRIARIERHLKLSKEDVRTDLSKLERIW